jgi:tetratricopeptide (TPR) repeat protein
MAADPLPDAPGPYRDALAALRCGDFAAADRACRVLLAAQPDFAAGWLTASNARLHCGAAATALEFADRALSLAPGQPRAQVQRAQCLLALGRTAEAEAAAGEAELRAGSDAVIYDAVGTVYSLRGDQQRALVAYERALALAPAQPGFLFNRAAVRRFLGDLAGAEADYDRVLELRPDDWESYKNRSDLRRQRPERNHVETLRALLARPIPTWAGEVQLRHALAKEYEDLGRYADSWEQLARGAALRRAHLRYDVDVDVATVDWIIEAFPRAAADVAGGHPSDEPIFIVGLPRSGTTLVDRILSSHPDVVSAGERNDLAQLVVAGVHAATGRARWPRRELIAHSAHVDCAALGRAYIAGTRPLTGRTPRFIDKMPLNYLYLGLLRRALPRARVIHLTRHPLAVCYAMYKTLFKDGYPFSYDLQEIARYYLGYRRLMAHWRSALPGFIYEQPYEALVGAQRAATEGLLQFCGLAWDEACLDFHRNPAPTTTASAAQVREPIYASSLGQWQHYAAQLAGLRQRLLDGGVPAAELAAR